MKAAYDRSHLFLGDRRWLGSDTYDCNVWRQSDYLHSFPSNPSARPEATALLVD